MPVGNLHEDLQREDESTGPSDRKFGLTLGSILSLLAIVKLISGSPWGLIFGVAGAVLLISALLRPSLLSAPNHAWFKFGLVLHRIVSPIILAVLFYGAIMPIGLLMRACGNDPLRLRLDKQTATYWLTRSDERPPSDSMRQQF